MSLEGLSLNFNVIKLKLTFYFSNKPLKNLRRNVIN
jgi:hypothetical protein